MIEAISKKITILFLNKGVISKELSEVYCYGFELIVSGLLNILIVILVSLLTGQILEGAVFLLCFIPIRQYCGGYHADTYLGCNLCFACLYGAALGIYQLLPAFAEWPVVAALCLFSVVTVLRFAPVENSNKPLTDKKKKRCRRISAVLIFLLSGGALLLTATHIHTGLMAALTLGIVAGMIYMEKIKNKRRLTK